MGNFVLFSKVSIIFDSINAKTNNCIKYLDVKKHGSRKKKTSCVKGKGDDF